MKDYFQFIADRLFNSPARSRPVNSVEYEHVDISEMQGIKVEETVLTDEDFAAMFGGART